MLDFPGQSDTIKSVYTVLLQIKTAGGMHARRTVILRPPAGSVLSSGYRRRERKGERKMSQMSDYVRRTFKENDDIRDAGLTTPDDVVRYDDICYGTDTKWQMLDVYRPKEKAGETLPVIVSVHGGGWVYGDKELYQFYCMSLAQRGFAVVNYTYRLAPEFQYPSSLEDTNLVFAWVMKHAEEYGMDTKNVFAVGDSAGGNLLGIYAAVLTNAEYAAQYPFRVPEGLKLNAAALNCGVYDVAMAGDEDEMRRELMKDLLPEKGSERELALISPVNHVTENYPPVFLMTAVNDFVKMQAPAMAEKLAEKNVPFTFKLYGDKDNRLPHVFHLNMRCAEGAVCNDEECAYFREHMR